MNGPVEQLVQLGGAIAILAAFLAAQLRALNTDDWTYLTLNLVGSAVLAVVAGLDRDWGFLLLETVWAIASAWGLVTKVRRSSLQ